MGIGILGILSVLILMAIDILLTSNTAKISRD